MPRRSKRPPRVDEAAYQAALEELAAALKDGDGDTSWADALPEAPELPDGPGAVTAVFVDQRRKR